MAKKLVKSFPLDGVVSIEINGNFVARLHQLQFSFLKNKTPEQFQNIMTELKKGDSTHPDAYHLQTVLFLIRELENEAVKKGLMVEKEIEVADA